MLFNSIIFIFVFLPVSLLLFYRVEKTSQKLTVLATASLIFYGYWNVNFIPLLCSSIAFNYSLGHYLAKQHTRTLLAIGIICNLLLLVYFKYAGFFWGMASDDVPVWVNSIVLPLGISFFTFQQITYLVDNHKGLAQANNLLEYSVFVLFFPQLVAGPIVHQKEMLQQFTAKAFGAYNYDSFNKGIFYFVIGLAKKVLIADNLAPSSINFFSAPETLDTLAAWIGALCYTFQLYFDFSGYCEMAIGIGLLFGVTLPINFASPYKSASIIEFWRRWHISLGRFFRDYFYIPLGGNKNPTPVLLALLFATALISGLWHGASWIFVIWGAFHGVMLAINHLNNKYKIIRIQKHISVTLTFLLVVIGWVVFYSPDLGSAITYLKAMFGFAGADTNLKFYLELPALLILSLLVFSAKNVHELYECREIYKFVFWLPAMICLAFFNLASPTEFLYFNF